MPLMIARKHRTHEIGADDRHKTGLLHAQSTGDDVGTVVQIGDDLVDPRRSLRVGEFPRGRVQDRETPCPGARPPPVPHL